MSDDQQADVVQVLREFGAAMQACMDAIVEVLQPVINAVVEACRIVYAHAHAHYRASGAIYGDTDDGMLRWWRELLEAERERRAANAIIARHQFLADIRTLRL